MFNKQYKNDEFLKTKLDEYIIEDKTAPDRLYTVSCDTVLNKFKNKENRKINIIEQLKIQSSFLSVGFWIISSVLLVSLGVLLAFIGEYQYTAVLFAVSPCIAIFGIPIILSS